MACNRATEKRDSFAFALIYCTYIYIYTYTVQALIPIYTTPYITPITALSLSPSLCLDIDTHAQ